MRKHLFAVTPATGQGLSNGVRSAHAVQFCAQGTQPLGDVPQPPDPMGVGKSAACRICLLAARR